MIIGQAALSQKIKVELHPLSTNIFYEGQYTEIALLVENTTSDSLPCNFPQICRIVNVLDATGVEVTNGNHEAYQVFKSHSTNMVVADKYFDLFPPKTKLQFTSKVSYFFNSNSTFTDMESKRETHYGFLRPGKYVVECEVSVEGFKNTYQFPIVVIAPKAELVERFNKLGKSIIIAESHGQPSSSIFVCDTLDNTILSFIQEYKNGAYTETAHKYPFTGMNNSASKCVNDPFYAWKFLNLLPQVYEGNEWMSYSENFYASMFADNFFCKLPSSNPNRHDYINAYLKKLEKFSPQFCDKIIAQASKCCDRTKLVNYARLRELNTGKAKKTIR